MRRSKEHHTTDTIQDDRVMLVLDMRKNDSLKRLLVHCLNLFGRSAVLAYLLEYEPSKAMAQEDDRPVFLTATSPFRFQSDQKPRGEIAYISLGATEIPCGVVAKGHDAGIADILCKKSLVT